MSATVPTPGRLRRVPVDHISRLQRADEREKAALARYRQAAEQRRAVIVSAHKSGMSLYEIANVLNVGHEAVRKLVRGAEAEA